jgi:hypothetical protein
MGIDVTERSVFPGSKGKIAGQEAAAKSHAPIQATYGAPDRPLRIGEIEIPCYVLVDGRRVLATRGLQAGLGFSRSGGSRPGARRLAGFLASLEAKGINTNDLIARINSPITFTPPHGGKPAEGYEATILPDICDVVARATDAGAILLPMKPPEVGVSGKGDMWAQQTER